MRIFSKMAKTLKDTIRDGSCRLNAPLPTEDLDALLSTFSFRPSDGLLKIWRNSGSGSLSMSWDLYFAPPADAVKVAADGTYSEYAGA
jgi:hypothetical protein